MSYAITDWIKLGKQYSPALEALIQIRDKDKQVLLSGNGGFTNFHDLSSINGALGEQQATLDLFFALEIQKRALTYFSDGSIKNAI